MVTKVRTLEVKQDGRWPASRRRRPVQGPVRLLQGGRVEKLPCGILRHVSAPKAKDPASANASGRKRALPVNNSTPTSSSQRNVLPTMPVPPRGPPPLHLMPVEADLRNLQ